MRSSYTFYVPEPPKVFDRASGAGETARETAAFHIRTAILSGRYPPGRLLKEKDLVAALPYSRTPVREALLTLASEGLVRLNSQTSATVEPADPKEVRELLALTLVVETLAARELVERGGDLTELEELQRQMAGFASDTSAESKVRFVDLDVLFHCAIAGAAGCANAALLLRRLRNRTRLHVPLEEITPAPRRAVLGEHEVLLAALRSGDLGRVEDAMRMHLVNRAGRWFQRHQEYLRTLHIFERSRGPRGA